MANSYTDLDCETIGVASIELAQVRLTLSIFIFDLQLKVLRTKTDLNSSIIPLVSATNPDLVIGSITVSLEAVESLRYFFKRKA